MRRSIFKRGLAICMMTVMSFLLPATPLYQGVSRAATVKTDASYISEVKLYVKKKGTLEDAMNWCKSQNDGWQVIKGDLNSGASGAFTKDVGVFFCYKTTTDPDEAITDLAVMNEKGNYSEGEYERLLKEQKDRYMDMVNNMKGMLTEYRTNFKNGVPMAVKAHDYLNAFIDDDSNTLLGDLLLDVDDEKLSEILLQANGIVVLTIEQQLASACDTAKTTWLDRMVKLGSYDGLKNAFSKNIQSGDIIKTLDKQYSEKAQVILDNWDDIKTRIDHISYFVEDLSKHPTKEEFDQWVGDMDVTGGEFASYEEFLSLAALTDYSYGGKTLFDFFKKSRAEIEKEGLELLYPMAASLTDGQLCALRESVGLFAIMQDALGANIYNNYNAGKSAEIRETASDEEKQGIQEIVDSIDNITDVANGTEKLSIYDGVDREIFSGGVAVTSETLNRSKGSDHPWTDAFYNSSGIGKYTYIFGVGAVSSAILAGVFTYAANHVNFAPIVENIYSAIKDEVNTDIGRLASQFSMSRETVSYIKNRTTDLETYAEKAFSRRFLQDSKTFKELMDAAEKKSVSYRVFVGLKWGFTVFTILLGVADIALNIYSIYKYYHTEHAPIPHHMVALSYSETKEESYVAYKSVRDQNGNCGDVNGGSSRQWLALYYTKDDKAGTPLLASEAAETIVMRTGSPDLPGEGYSPLHMFNTPGVAQDLTFSDGENGYSYNDRNEGTYLFFKHAAETGEEEIPEQETGTVLPGDVLDQVTVRIHPAGDSGKALGIADNGGGSFRQNVVHLWAISESSRLYLTKAGDESYHISFYGELWDAKVDGRYFDIDNNRSYDKEGSVIHIVKGNKDAINKSWRFIKRDDGTYYIRNERSGQYLSLEDTNSTDDGNRAVQSYTPFAWMLEIAASSDKDIKTIKEYDSYTHNQVNSVNWMGAVKDDTLLTDMDIPGTHDAATMRTNYLRIFAQCQLLSIRDQLNAGVRYFDIRLGVDTFDIKTLNLVHGMLTTCEDENGDRLRWNKVKGWIEDFLNNNPTETVILQIKADESIDRVESIIPEQLSGWDHVYRGDHIPTLGEARGKVVVLSRLSDDLDYGSGENRWAINAHDWQEGNEKTKSFDKVVDNTGYAVYSQDCYDMNGTDKIEWVKNSLFEGDNTADKLHDKYASEKPTWIISYTSCASKTPIGAARKVHSYLKPELYKQKKNTVNTFLGVVCSDFVDEELSWLIYSRNYDRGLMKEDKSPVVSDKDAGTSISSGTIVLVGGAGFLAGFLIWVAATISKRNRKK